MSKWKHWIKLFVNLNKNNKNKLCIIVNMFKKTRKSTRQTKTIESFIYFSIEKMFTVEGVNLFRKACIFISDIQVNYNDFTVFAEDVDDFIAVNGFPYEKQNVNLTDMENSVVRLGVSNRLHLNQNLT